MLELNNIKESSILQQEDFAFLTSIAEELIDTLKKRQIFRTETEITVSVLNEIQYPTIASKYWQSVREQAVMLENLVISGFDYRRNEIRIKQLIRQLSTTEDEFDRENLQIDLDECIFKRTNMELSAKDRIREIKLWSKIKTDLDNGSFDTKDVNTHQLVSYAQRFILQAFNAPDNMPVAEANNLKGQLASAVHELEERGMLQEVLQVLPATVVNRVLLETGILRLSTIKTV